MKIRTENLRVRLCPVCGDKIKVPFLINIYLNDGSTMPQPVCVYDIEEMRREETQKSLLFACKTIWKNEIMDNPLRTDEEKGTEIQRIERLEVVYKND